jgi:hypothetical protein
MVHFMSGAVTLAYVIAAMYFANFWRRTADRLFLSFSIAFALLAMNQFLVFLIGAGDERGNYAYVLRILGFLLILFAILDKNTAGRTRRRR